MRRPYLVLLRDCENFMNIRAGGLHQPDPGAREAGGGPEPPRAPGHHLPHPRQLQPLARQHLRAAEAGGDQGGGRGVRGADLAVAGEGHPAPRHILQVRAGIRIVQGE